MAILPKNARRHLIKPYLDNAKINWGTIALAQLISNNFVSRVLTVNFDLVLENACGLLGLQPAVYDFGVAPANDPAMIVSPAMTHLHGQSYGLVLLNTEEETRKHREKLLPIIRDTLRTAPLVVAGYSGSADGIFHTLLEEFDGRDRLYWAGYETEPQAHIAPFLKKDHFRFLGGADFDRLMIELAQLLGCWPPNLFSNPLGHLLEELSPVVSYPIVDFESAVDILRDLRRKLKSWQKRLGEGDNLSNKLQQLYMKGEFEEAAKAFVSLKDRDAVSKEEKDIAGWAFLGWANLLSKQAERIEGDEAVKAAESRPKKYRAAQELQPDKFEIRIIGVRYSFRKRRDCPRLTWMETLAEAAEKFQEASRIKPDDYDTLCNWGSVLFEQAKRSKGEQSTRLFEEAAVKYQSALALKPEDHELLYNWAVLISELSERVTGEEGVRQIAAAIDKYRALAVKPDDQETLFYLTKMLLKEAKHSHGERSVQLVAEAREKMPLLKVSVMGPYNMACLAALDDNHEECRRYLEMAQEGKVLPDVNHLLTDRDLNSVRDTQWFQEMVALQGSPNKS